jgi:hypothetical protein
MEQSFIKSGPIPHRTLEERLITIQTVKTDEAESYEIMKDSATGEHYLHYWYLHLNVQAGGSRENFHHFLPLESDDVLGVIFGEQPYQYPDHWRKPYLRNGPDDTYVWFDPSSTDSFEVYESLGKQISEKLADFKKHGSMDEASIKKLMDDLDNM